MKLLKKIYVVRDETFSFSLRDFLPQMFPTTAVFSSPSAFATIEGHPQAISLQELTNG